MTEPYERFDEQLFDTLREELPAVHVYTTYRCKRCLFAVENKAVARGHVADHHAVKDKMSHGDYKLFLFEEREMFELYVEMNRYSTASHWQGPRWYSYEPGLIPLGRAYLVPVHEIIDGLFDRALRAKTDGEKLVKMLVEKGESKLKQNKK